MKIEEVRAQLSYAVRSRLWTGNLRRMAFAKAVRGSNSIEGYLVSKDDALAAVDEEPPMGAEMETWQNVMGYRKALSYVLQLSVDPSFRFSRGLIKSLHFMMMDHAITNVVANPTVSSDFFMLSSSYFRCSLTPGAFYTASGGRVYGGIVVVGVTSP